MAKGTQCNFCGASIDYLSHIGERIVSSMEQKSEMKWPFTRKTIEGIFLLLLACLITGCFYVGLFSKPIRPSSGPLATGEGPLPNKIGVVLFNLKRQVLLEYGLEGGIYKDAVRQIREAILRQGFKLVEEESIYQYFSCRVDSKDWDIICSLMSDKSKEMLNIDAALIGYYGLGEENRAQPDPVPLPSFNDACYARMKLIDIASGKILWSGEGDATAWTQKAAVRKAIDELLEQFERDVNRIREEKDRKR